MIVDSSALLSVMFRELDAAHFAAALSAAQDRRLSAANWVEASIVVDSRGGSAALADFDHFLRLSRIELVPVTIEIAQLARRAYQTYGKGIHPAALNFGDCFAYATAKHFGEPLLFKGDDFGQTDIEPAAARH